MLLGQAIYSCDHVTLPSQRVTLTGDCPSPYPASPNTRVGLGVGMSKFN
jgi:hypothetical protein